MDEEIVNKFITVLTRMRNSGFQISNINVEESEAQKRRNIEIEEANKKKQKFNDKKRELNEILKKLKNCSEYNDEFEKIASLADNTAKELVSLAESSGQSVSIAKAYQEGIEKIIKSFIEIKLGIKYKNKEDEFEDPNIQETSNDKPIFEEQKQEKPIIQEPQFDENLYKEIVRLVIETNNASTSFIQRKFKLGFSRAVRYVDLLEENGIIGPSDGINTRKVLVSLDDIKENNSTNTFN